VEAPERRHDRVPTAAAVLAGELDRALVGLGTGVREEDLAVRTRRGGEQEAVDCLRRVGRGRIGEEVADVDERAGLLGDRVGHHRVGVAERHHGDPREEVEVLGSRGRPTAGAVATDEHGLWRPEHGHERTVLKCPPVSNG
jgi:hypothetical protein